ncbi:MAG: hypothetical protein KTR24_06160 [Saprospiraceae bacterium]|nr:hypothetical protein [Saprospiraceae bacterium]
MCSKKERVTQINPAARRSAQFCDMELEILHMLSYEYEISEMTLECELNELEIGKMIQKLYEKLDVDSKPGLVRAAFESGLLQIY